MSCLQNQQQCQPPPKCPPKCSPKCPPKDPPQCPAPCPPLASSCCGPSSGRGVCCLSHHRPSLFHRHRHQSPDCCECEPSGCRHSSGGCC
ncbi:late cornified envelope protein 2A-like [Crocuta crocuta]